MSKHERFECISGCDKKRRIEVNRREESHGDIYDENYDGIVLHDRWSLYRSRDENR